MATKNITKGTKSASKKKKPTGKRLPGFFSDYGGSGIVVDSMPGKKTTKK